MKARYFFAGSFIALVAAVGFLIYYQRTANGMVAKVEQADLVAANPNTTQQLAELEQYVTGHMGVSVAVGLEGSYQRATQAAQAAANTQANPGVYAQAQAACAKGDSVTQSKCMSAYISSHSAPGANPQPAVMPNAADFTKSYHGASWTMDGTGTALLMSVLMAAWGLFLLFQRPRHHQDSPQRHYRGPRPNPQL